MRNVKKYLKIQDLELITVQEHPRDISRAHLKVIDESREDAIFKTFKYGAVEPTRVTWESAVELPFHGQQSLRYQTACEHEYGYQIQELKALYNGVIYLKPDQFFFQNTTHCFNQQGEQCGVLKFMVKVVEREFIVDHGEEKVDKKDVAPKQPVKVNLLAKVSMYGASLVVNSYFINVFHKKKKRKLKLQIKFDSLNFNGLAKFGELQYKWLISNSKFEVYDNSPDVISVSITEDDHPYLEGMLTMAALQANKRFTVQVVQLKDQNDQNLAAIHLDLRYISKKQLLDLMYSPTQLANNKLQRKQGEQISFKHSRVFSNVQIKMSQEKKLFNLLHNRSLSKQIQANRNHSPIHRYRYKSRVAREHQDTTIPRSKRFSDHKSTNEKVSYIEPSFLSDFSPPYKNKKGVIHTQSTSNRNDFTKPIKEHPGVGQYHLPSIWQRK